MRRMYSKPQLLEAVEQESKINGIKVFEDIKDKDGHNRFIEGTITYPVGEVSGVTQIYGKWSLSGTHLLIVLCIKYSEGASVLSKYATINNVPQWLKDKIVALFGDGVDYKVVSCFASDGTTQQINTYLRINDEHTISIQVGQMASATKERSARISFDLLIDNE